MAIRSERRFIALNKVRPGMMVEFNYSKKDGGSGKYVVLVIDPEKTNDHARESQLHGCVIGELTDEQLVSFFASFRKPVQMGTDRRASVVEGLDSDEAYDAFMSSAFAKDRPYRTFNRSGISQMRQILLGSSSD